MKLLSWNYQGLGSPLTIQELKAMVAQDVLILMETKNQEEMLHRIQRRLRFSSCIIENPIDLAGGLAVFWNDGITLTVDWQTSAFIDMICVEGEYGTPMRLTCLHAPAVYHLRQALWDNLRQISHYNTLPWVCIEDFNEIIHPWEKVGKRLADQHRMHSFREFLNNCYLMEVPNKGYAFTWRNNRNGQDCVKEKLDRVLCTMDWRLNFPTADVYALPAIGSDHSPILLTTEVIPQKLRAVSEALTRWSRSKFSNGHRQINICKQHLLNLTWRL